MSTFDNAVDDIGKIGKFKAILGLICGITIGACLLCSGSFVIANNNDDQYANITGTIVSADCKRFNKGYDKYRNPQYVHKCVLKVSYVYNNINYDGVLDTNQSTGYIKGQSISISVEKKNPNNIRQAGLSSYVTGSILSGVAILIVGCATINYYLTYHSKYYAAASGVGTIVDATQLII